MFQAVIKQLSLWEINSSVDRIPAEYSPCQLGDPLMNFAFVESSDGRVATVKYHFVLDLHPSIYDSLFLQCYLINCTMHT